MVRAAPDSFFEFAIDAETPLATCRGKMFAVHVLLGERGAPTEELLDSVRTLVAETLNSLDDLRSAHTGAFASVQKART